MKNTFGTSVTVTLFGESHGPEIGAVLDGLAPGLPVDETFIASQLTLRRPAGSISTARQEADPFRIVSGVCGGRTTGTPLAILIPNGDTRSSDYTRGPARPGHADQSAFAKYHGFEDYRGGGHFSGRITAALVAAGAIVLSALRERGIRIGTHIARCAGVDDASFGKLTHELTITEVVPLGIQGKLGDSVSGPDTYFVTGFPGETAGGATYHLGDGGIYAYGDPDGPADGGSGILSLGASC